LAAIFRGAITPQPVIGMSRNTDRHGPESPSERSHVRQPTLREVSQRISSGPCGQSTICDARL